MKTINKPTPRLPSIVRKESYGPVTIYWLDREAAKQQAKRAAEQLLQARPEVIAVYLFGSLAKNKAGPRSDVDILVVLRESDIPIGFKRLAVYAEYFDEVVELPTELFCFTLDELPRKAVARHALQYAELLAGTDIRAEVNQP